jgi:hypothetical protein
MKTTITVLILTLITNIGLSQKNVPLRQLPDVRDTALISNIFSSQKNYRIDTLDLNDTLTKIIYVKNDMPDPTIFEDLSEPIYEYAITAKLLTSKKSVILLPGETIPLFEATFYHRLNAQTNENVNIQIDKVYSGALLKMFTGIGTSVYLRLPPILRTKSFEIKYDTLLFGPIILDGKVTKSLIFKNLWDRPLTITAVSTSLDTGSFEFKQQFPLNIAPYDSVTIPFTYSPVSTSPTVSYRHAVVVKFTSRWDGLPWTNITNTFVGIAIEPTADSIATPLFPDTRQVLAMLAPISPTKKKFHFVNNLSTDVKIVSVALTDTSSYRITDIQPSTVIPFTLAPTERMSVEIELFDTTRGVHYTELQIGVENAIATQSFEIQGLQRPMTTASTKHLSDQPPYITIYPNPMSDAVHISTDEINDAVIEIYNLLGEQIFQYRGNEVSWDRLTISGSRAPAGTYIVRITGSRSGSSYVASKILIVR